MRSLCIVLCLLWATLAFGQKQVLIDRVIEGRSDNTNPVAARAEITTQGTERVVEGLVKEIIGESKYARNKSVIMQKVVRNSSRFIPFARPGELQPDGAGFKMTLALKLSVDDLQKLLLENGLFYESDTMPVVMPLIRWMDKLNSRSYSWWMDNEDATRALLVKENRNFENDLKQAFSRHQFYVVRPAIMKYRQVLGRAFRSERLNPDDWQILNQKLGAQIILEGQIQIQKSSERSEAARIEIKISALQVMNGRPIAEVSRQFETDAGPYENVVSRKLKEVMEQTAGDLASQVLEAWQRGTIGASLYRLTLKGRLPLNQQEAFKETLKSKVREIKNIKERLITNDELVFELDSSLTPKDMAQRLTEFELPGLKIVLSSSSDNEIVYRVQRGELR